MESDKGGNERSEMHPARADTHTGNAHNHNTHTTHAHSDTPTPTCAHTHIHTHARAHQKNTHTHQGAHSHSAGVHELCADDLILKPLPVWLIHDMVVVVQQVSDRPIRPAKISLVPSVSRRIVALCAPPVVVRIRYLNWRVVYVYAYVCGCACVYAHMCACVRAHVCVCVCVCSGAYVDG